MSPQPPKRIPSLLEALGSLQTQNRAFQGAFRRGYEAGSRGDPITSCPYPDIPTASQTGPTWSRAFRHYWARGWETARGFRTP